MAVGEPGARVCFHAGIIARAPAIVNPGRQIDLDVDVTWVIGS